MSGSKDPTQKYYTRLGLVGTAGAIRALSGIKAPTDSAPMEATGTLGPEEGTAGDLLNSDPQRYPQQLARETVQSGATRCDEVTASGLPPASRNPAPGASSCDPVRGGAMERLMGLEPTTFSLGSWASPADWNGLRALGWTAEDSAPTPRWTGVDNAARAGRTSWHEATTSRALARWARQARSPRCWAPRGPVPGPARRLCSIADKDSFTCSPS